MTYNYIDRKCKLLFLAVIIAVVAAFVGILSYYRHYYSYPKELVRADSLLNENSKQGCTYFCSIKRKGWGKSVDWYYRLLRIKAKLRNGDKSGAYDIDEAIKVSQHYESWNADKRQLPFAYYFLGRIYCQKDNMPMALEFYHKALTTISSDDINMKSILNFQIGYLLFKQSFHKESLPYFKESLVMERTRNDSVMMAYVMQKIAYAYQESKNDSCLFFYEEALSIAKKIKKENLYNEILSSLATYYIESKEYRKAKSCAMPILSTIKDGNPAIASFLYVAATSCMMLGENTQAIRFYHELGEQDEIEAQAEAYLNLSKIYRNDGNVDKAFEYLAKYEQANDSLQKTIKTEAIARMFAAYNYSSYKAQNVKLEKRNSLMFAYSIIVSLLIFIGVISFIVWHHRTRRLAREQEQRLKKFRAESVERSKKYVAESEKNIEILKSQLAKAETENDEIRLKYDNAMRSLDITKQKIAIEENTKMRFLKTDIYVRIEKEAEKSVILSDDDLRMLEMTVTELYPNFKPRLYDMCQLSIQDFRMCLLIKTFNFSVTKISSLLGRDHSTISKAIKKLQICILGGKASNREFIKFIKDL